MSCYTAFYSLALTELPNLTVTMATASAGDEETGAWVQRVRCDVVHGVKLVALLCRLPPTNCADLTWGSPANMASQYCGLPCAKTWLKSVTPYTSSAAGDWVSRCKFVIREKEMNISRLCTRGSAMKDDRISGAYGGKLVQMKHAVTLPLRESCLRLAAK